MGQTFHVVRCYSCLTFQSQQVRKDKKFVCKICGAKQSVKKEYGRGSGKDCRVHVQKLNSTRRDLEAEQERRLNDQIEEDEQNSPPRTLREFTSGFPTVTDQGVHNRAGNTTIDATTNSDQCSKWSSYLASDSGDSSEDDSIPVAASPSTLRNLQSQVRKSQGNRRQTLLGATSQQTPWQQRNQASPIICKDRGLEKSQFSSSFSRSSPGSSATQKAVVGLTSGGTAGLSMNVRDSKGNFLVYDNSDGIQEVDENKFSNQEISSSRDKRGMPDSPSRNIKFRYIVNNFQNRDRYVKMKCSAELRTQNTSCIPSSITDGSTPTSSTYKLDKYKFTRAELPMNLSSDTSYCKHPKKFFIQSANTRVHKTEDSLPDQEQPASSYHSTPNINMPHNQNDQTKHLLYETSQSNPKKLCVRNGKTLESDINNSTLENCKISVLQEATLMSLQKQPRLIGLHSGKNRSSGSTTFSMDALYKKFEAADDIDDISDLGI